MKTKIFLLLFLFPALTLNASDLLENKKFEFSVSNGKVFHILFKNSKYLVQTPDQLIYVKGFYEIKDNTIIFSDAGGIMACPKDQKGIYTFKYENGSLKLTLVEEECKSRKGLTSYTWKEIKTN